MKDLLDVADNLERAAGAVPPAALNDAEAEAVTREEALRLLRSLVEGVSMTDKVLYKVRFFMQVRLRAH